MSALESKQEDTHLKESRLSHHILLYVSVARLLPAAAELGAVAPGFPL